MAFVRIFNDGKLLEQRELTTDRLTIGRAPDNDIVLNSVGVSKHHAVIERQGQQYLLRDLDSANGIFFKNERVTEHALQYWDEVHIFNHVLKFMASSRLKGEEAGATDQAPDQTAQEATMAVDMRTLGDLAQLRKQAKVPAVVLSDDAMADKRDLDKVNFRIGKGNDCDLQLGGWLAPKLAAHIQRRNDGFYLVPARRGKVSLNGRHLKEQAQLNDGDAIVVQNIHLTFYNRPSDQY